MFRVKGINKDGNSVIETWSLPLEVLAENLLTRKFKQAYIFDQDNVMVGGVRLDIRRLHRIWWVRNAAIAQSAE